MTKTDFDLFIIGGGINGCGIARDAAGRGLRVGLAEKNDLGWATSSASTKLFHGGLRYLEYFEFRLVREALIERERLLRAMPHISWPMRFVLPYHKDMRFESTTPTSRLLSTIMPWMKGQRPAWLIRLGLFLYDSLGPRRILPGTKTLALRKVPEGAPLQDRFTKAFEYSDCWVEDSRLVILNARDAQARGAQIMPRTEVVTARRAETHWEIETKNVLTGETDHRTAKMLINASGPWGIETIAAVLGRNTKENMRLVRGSHIVIPKLYEHDKSYFLQGTDGRIIFTIPYETDFTLIGTTDADHEDPDVIPVCTDEERDYLLNFVNHYFKQQITADDIVWTYSGVRPLYDDGAQSASAATRDYVLTTDTNGPFLLNVFGGKITTYRKLAESAMDEISEVTEIGASWTKEASLPGGDFPVYGVDALTQQLKAAFPFLTDAWALRLIRAYGSEAETMLGDAETATDLGADFGGTLTAREVDWLIGREWALTADDILWRRSKLGLRIDQTGRAALEDYLASAAISTS